MSSDDYHVQNIYRYSRKTFKKNRRDSHDSLRSPRDNANIEITETSPRSEVRSDGFMFDSPGCSCDLDTETDLANILHKKCPVITLAQQQLQRLLEETDKLLCENTNCCRPLHDLLCYCKVIILRQNKYILVFLIAISFLMGLILGAGTCGSYLGRFNSPILTCLENFFIADTYSMSQATFLGIV